MLNNKQVKKVTKNVMKTINTKLVLYVLVFLSVVSVASQLFAQNYSYVGSFVALAVVTGYFTRSMSAILLVPLVIVNLLVGGNYLREGMTQQELDVKINELEKKLENASDEQESKRIMDELNVLKNTKVDIKIKNEIKEGFKERIKHGKKGGKKNKPKKAKQEETDVEKGENMNQMLKKMANGQTGVEDEEEGVEDEGFRPKKRLVQRGKPKYLKSKHDSDEAVGESIDYASTLEQAYGNLEKMLGKGGMKGLTKETSKLVGQQKELMDSLSSMAPLLNDAQKTLKGFNLPDMGNIKKMMSSMGSFNQK
jgi:uncharacterized membrane protein YciS (DUF1049 family)